MGVILDTSVIIKAERNEVDFNSFKNYGECFISSITASELLIGVHRANTEERRLKRSIFVEHILSSITILPFEEEEARVHAQLFAYLQEKGQMIGAHDLIIAATALSNGFAVYTFNKDEFIRIPNLIIL